MNNYIKKEILKYFVGLFFSLIILTFSIFLIVNNIFSKLYNYVIILFFSIAQLVLYFNIFLHIKYKNDEEYYNIITIIFSLIIIFIIIFGSRFIMLSLHNRIMIN
ncbi:cytochrome C oxidase subunit IV family protein [Buchnera aphidicola]|uniref:cytochrome C oxidase subunit IV family protein n=1 Tax=Buchnera aphidicola TaxID=9 RepID=UPI0031B829F4